VRTKKEKAILERGEERRGEKMECENQPCPNTFPDGSVNYDWLRTCEGCTKVCCQSCYPVHMNPQTGTCYQLSLANQGRVLQPT